MGVFLLILGFVLFFTKFWVIGLVDWILLFLFARGEFWYRLNTEVIGDLIESLGDIDWSDIGSGDGGFDGGGDSGGGE